MNLGVIYPTHRNLRYFSKRFYSEILRFFTFRNTEFFISDSKNTSTELKKYLDSHNLKQKDRVIYLAAPHSFNIRPRKPTQDKYFLCMGDFSPRKNLEMIFESFRLFLNNNNSNHKLYVIVSTKDESIRIKKLSEKYYLMGKTIIITSPTDKYVLNLYQSAVAFLFPSLYEGFGLPILESMSSGCPVITSDYGAMKEIAGIAAILVNPKSSNSICRAMQSLASDYSLRKNIIEAGQIHTSNFSWKSAAKKTIEVYKEVNKNT
jgi:glycosyltransferase involved in cell wall biosynthesis